MVILFVWPSEAVLVNRGTVEYHDGELYHRRDRCDVYHFGYRNKNPSDFFSSSEHEYYPFRLCHTRLHPDILSFNMSINWSAVTLRDRGLVQLCKPTSLQFIGWYAGHFFMNVSDMDLLFE